nr:MAG TPA: hypothetical protein [Caudoviricetes sp.]DAU83657.1 MAG TPA: hypothetical protein [Caudoviricetes sp.]DAZ34029.1 MAG TPA: hypothetical protein [Caudoviricetes sp.]DAZ46054.1 MAG TPA: hypothetical protein [Caudoviricetes sp.]DAZ78384.1 MAG TPA: hypothetical protein [Caudoviricetes sp.]
MCYKNRKAAPGLIRTSLLRTRSSSSSTPIHY